MSTSITMSCIFEMDDWKNVQKAMDVAHLSSFAGWVRKLVLDETDRILASQNIEKIG